MIYQLLGYAPDADPTTPGVITQAIGVVPSLRGMKGAPSPASSGMATLAGTCMGAALVAKLDLTTRLFAGTSAKLYEAGASTWTDVSRAATYTTSSTGVWRFAQQSNVSFAANGANTIQASPGSGAFSCIAGAPIAAIVEVVGKFVFALNTSSNAHGVQWSALNDFANWSASASTQAGSDLLTTTSGPITAGRRFGSTIVVYKKNSMYLGINSGPPNIWEFQLIPGTAGALSQEVVVNVGTPENPKHIFMGEDDFYSYDGSKPVRLGTNRVKEEVFGNIQQSRYYACKALHDRKNSLIYFYYPTIDSVMPNSCRVYNYRTDRWGVDNRQVEAATDFSAASVSYDGLGSLYATYADFPNVSYDVAFVGNTQTQPAIFTTSHVLQTLTGPAGITSLTTGDVGDPVEVVCYSRVRPLFLTAPSSASWIPQYRMSLGDSLASDAAVNLSSSGAFDFMREARWYRGQLQCSGDWEMAAISMEGTKGSLE